jgi:hypothetical protein
MHIQEKVVWDAEVDQKLALLKTLDRKSVV